MREFLEKTFGPNDLAIIDTVLEDWRTAKGFPKGSEEAAIGAAVALNLYREGNDTVPTLFAAIGRHLGLAGLAISTRENS